MIRSVEANDGGMPGGGDFGRTKEGLTVPIIEIRRADLERDSEAIADMFNQPTVIEHLAGVAPRQTPRIIARFRANVEKHITLSPGATMTAEGLKNFADDIIIATPNEVKAYFAKLSRVETYVAEIGGRVVGTASLEKPSPTQSGKRVGTIFKVAVDPDAPKAIESSRYGKGIARSLVRVINNRAQELSLTSVQASIIKGIKGYLSPISLFTNEGYNFAGESPRDTLGWDNTGGDDNKGAFVERDTIKMQLAIPRAS